ncbi:MAG: hypothetical protein OXC17_02740 [Aestuariivita sp.]|nr:hypothetical protein [Aestuariivita sp.]
MAESSGFDRNVFVNCPFDAEYAPVLEAMLFCLIRLGLNPRIATERSDSGETRIDKILELVQSSRYSIHDLSRCQAQTVGEHYRLNMPFELGIDFGCRRFGPEPQSGKVFLVLEEKPYRYQAAISDSAGFDIQAHKGDFEVAVRKLCNWIMSYGGSERVEAARVVSEYADFQEWYWRRRLSEGASDEDIRDTSTAALMRAMRDWFESGSPRN